MLDHASACDLPRREEEDRVHMVEERGLRESQLQRAMVEEGQESFQVVFSYRRYAARRAALLLGAC